ncbi:MAG: hypothetical protein QW051_02280 [Candidatus Aenigmatarchaeota archaeon]
MTITLIDIKNILLDFFTNYAIAVDYRFIYVDELLQQKDIKYPAVIFDLSGINISRGSTMYSIDVYVLDLIDKHDKANNYLDVISECERIFYDVIAYLRAADIVINDNRESINCAPIYDVFNDDVISGIKTTIEIRAENTINSCSIPLKSSPGVVLKEDGGSVLLE